jgi:hypothetical protein
LPDTDPLTVWLDDARDTIADVIPHPDLPFAVTGRIYDVAETLLAAVTVTLDTHRPIRRYWCQECSTLYPCTTRREITAALLGETIDD